MGNKRNSRLGYHPLAGAATHHVTYAHTYRQTLSHTHIQIYICMYVVVFKVQGRCMRTERRQQQELTLPTTRFQLPFTKVHAKAACWCPEGTLINCNRVVLLVVVWLCRRNYQKRNTTMRLKAVAATTAHRAPSTKCVAISGKRANENEMT